MTEVPEDGVVTSSQPEAQCSLSCRKATTGCGAVSFNSLDCFPGLDQSLTAFQQGLIDINQTSRGLFVTLFGAHW